MKKILSLLLLFAFSINVILAQVATIDIATPYSNGLSNNQVDDFDVNTDGTILNNSASGGTSQLGNTAVTANTNISAGSEANLILFQVTTTSASSLNGQIEVFGSEAGVIIANPNGITCDGCGFINTSKVDLVTGTANFSGDDLTSFSIYDVARLIVSGNGFVSDAVADELNLVSRTLIIKAQVKANTTLRILAGNDTYDHTTNIITSDTTEATAHSIQISASGSLEANYIELINTEISSSGIYGIVNYGRDISADSLKLDSNGLFRNQESGGSFGNIDVSGLLEVINAERFINNGNITADTLTITTDEFSNNHNGNTQLGKIVVTDIFSLSTPNASYTNTGTVATDSLNLTTSGNFDHESGILGNFTFNNLSIIADNYTQGVTIDIAGDISIQVSGEASLDDNASIKANNLFFSAYDLYNQADFTITENAIFDLENEFSNGLNLGGTEYDGGDIIAHRFNVTARGNFYNRYNATINASHFNITVGGLFSNRYSSDININNRFYAAVRDIFYNTDAATISASNLTISVDSFVNTHAGGDGNINADNTVSLYVAGDFDYSSDYLNNGNISANALNFQVGRDLIYNDINNDFVWDINNIIKVLRNVSFNVDSFYNRGTIEVRNEFNGLVQDSFYNLDKGTILARNFNITVGGLFSNRYDADININKKFSATVRDILYNTHSATISANNMTISADSFVNIQEWEEGTINTGRMTLSVAGDFDYAKDLLNNGEIRMSFINLQVGGDFSYDDTNDDFVWESRNSLVGLGSVFVTVDSFTNYGEITSGTFSLSVAGDFDYFSDYINNGNIDATHQNFTARNGAFTNNTSIDLVGNLGITANDFINTGRNISADILTLSLIGDFDYAKDYLNNGNIDATTLNFQVGGDFTYDDANNNFVWDANNSLVVFGNASFNVASFYNRGKINVANDLNVIADEFYNWYGATINTDNFNVIAQDSFYNQDTATINANDLTISTDSFVNTHTLEDGNINADILTLSLIGNFDYATDYLGNGNIDTTTLNLQVYGDFSYNDTNNDFVWDANNSLVVLGSASLDVDDFYNRGKIDIANDFNVTARDNFFNQNNATIEANNFSITAQDRFYNLHSATINANSFNLTVGGLFANRYYATINANNFNVSVGDILYNTDAATINANALTITADSFINSHTRGDGNIQADILNLSLAGDFGYENSLINNNLGNINATIFNFQVGGDFSYNDTNSNFAWNTNNSLVVLGSAYFNVNGFYNRGTIDVANDFNLTAGDDFYNWYGATINTDSFNVLMQDRFYNLDSATINANSFNLTVGGLFANRYDANINANDFNVTAADSFYNTDSATINASELTISADSFSNGNIRGDGNIQADILTLSLTGDFIYGNSFINNNLGNIDATTLNFQVGGDFTYGDANNNFVWDPNNSLVVLGRAFFNVAGFYNRGKIDVANDFNVTARDDFYNWYGATINTDNLNVLTQDRFYNLDSATINANDFNLTVGGLFANRYDAKISANGFNVSVGDNFYNTDAATINANTLTITANSFINNSTQGAGNIIADTFALSVAGDFDYVAEFLGNGAITTNALNLNVRGDFSYNDTNSNFIWHANNSLVVLGSASLNLDDFYNRGKIDIANDFNVTARDDFFNQNSATIEANNFSVTVQDRFYNLHSATIKATDFNLTVGGLFANRYDANINTNNNFNVSVGDNFYNTDAATISANALTISADSFINNSTQGAGNIIADTFALSVAGDFDYVAEFLGNGAITTNALNLSVRGDFSYNDTNSNFIWHANNSLVVLGSASLNLDDFYNRGKIDIANDFNVTARDDFFNQNSATIEANNFSVTVQDRFYNLHSATIKATDFNLTVGGLFANRYDANINTNNNFNVSVGDNFYNTDAATISANALTISADSFINSHTRGDGDINAGILTLSLIGDFDYAKDFQNNGTITTNSLNLNVRDDFSYNNTNSNFAWHANNSLVVLGNASFNVAGFYNRGTIDVAHDFNVTVGDDFYNWYGATINATDFNLLTQDRFYNLHSATINANDFNLTVGGLFANRYDANINANNNFNIYGEILYNTDAATISANALTISADSFVNSHTRGDGNIQADILTLSLIGDFDYAKDFQNNGTITTNSLNLNVRDDFSYNDTNSNFIWHANNSLVVLGNASFNVAGFYNRGKIDVAHDFNVTVGDDFYNWYGATINATDFNLLTQDRFYNLHSATINANDFNLTVGGLFANRYDANINTNNNFNIYGDILYNTDAATINANALTITANSFVNSHTRGDGNIQADILTLSLIGDFDYVKDFQNNGNIDATNQDFIARNGDFTNNTNIDLVGNLRITANDFINTGGSIKVDTLTLSLIGDFDYAKDFQNNGDIEATNQNFILGGDFTNNTDIDLVGNLEITANDVINTGGINVNSFNVTAEQDFFNDGSATISADNFNVTAGDYFYNWRGATISADNFNVVAERFSNETNATISADYFNINSLTSFYNYDSTINTNNFNVVARYDFYNYGDANITANNFNVAVRYDFYNYGDANITANDFNVIAEGSFNNYGNTNITADNFNATVGDKFNNYATIEGNSLTITADSFVNTHSYWGDGNINAAELNLYLTEGFDYTSDYLNNGNINATTLNIFRR